MQKENKTFFENNISFKKVILLSLAVVFFTLSVVDFNSVLGTEGDPCSSDAECHPVAICDGTYLMKTEEYRCDGGSCTFNTTAFVVDGSLETSFTGDCRYFDYRYCVNEKEVWERSYGCEVEAGEPCCRVIDDKFFDYCSGFCEEDPEDEHGAYCIDASPVRTRPAQRTATLTGDSALLVGELLDLEGEPTRNVWFRWGTDSSLTSYTDTAQEALSSTGLFSKEISFPESFGTIYYFRAMAEDPEDMARGRILSFIVSKPEGQIKIGYDPSEPRYIDIREGGVVETRR